MVSDGMGARAVDVLLGQIHDSDGPPQQVIMRTLLKVLFMAVCRHTDYWVSSSPADG